MKNSYHTNIRLAHYFGILDKDIAAQIPRSTRNDWAHLNLHKIVGLDYGCDKYNKNIDTLKEIAKCNSLLAFNRSILAVRTVLLSIFSNEKILKLALQEHKNEIIDVINLIKNRIGIKNALEIFGMSIHQFRYWSKKTSCVASPFGLCRKVYYNQLTEYEVNCIKDYLICAKFINWSLIAVYYQMIRDGIAFFSATTFYKYAKLLNLSELHKPIRKKKYKIGLRASKAKQILHMDMTLIRALDGSRIYISFIVDNFSRNILGWKASLKYSSEFVLENLKEVIQNHCLAEKDLFIDLIVDGGSENKGKVDEFLLQPEMNIRKLIAYVDIMFSNSMVEAVNKKIKYDYLFTRSIQNLNDLLAFLPLAVMDYNNRPHPKLFGLTPNEVLGGEIPNKNRFDSDMKNAFTKRIFENLNSNCNKCVA